MSSSIPSYPEDQLHRSCKCKISESDHCVITYPGNMLLSFSVCDHRMSARSAAVSHMGHMPVSEHTGDSSRINTLRSERFPVKSTGRHRNLTDRTVPIDMNLLRTVLPVVGIKMSMPVIKNIPFPIDLLNTSMIYSV